MRRNRTQTGDSDTRDTRVLLLSSSRPQVCRPHKTAIDADAKTLDSYLTCIYFEACLQTALFRQDERR